VQRSIVEHRVHGIGAELRDGRGADPGRVLYGLSQPQWRVSVHSPGHIRTSHEPDAHLDGALAHRVLSDASASSAGRVELRRGDALLLDLVVLVREVRQVSFRRAGAREQPIRNGVVLSLLAGALCIGCSSRNAGDGSGYLGGEAGVLTCPAYPSDGACTGPAASYSADVAPIFAAHCTGCHGAKVHYADVRLDSYAAVLQHLTTARTQIQECVMPPDLPPVSVEEAGTLDCWCVGGQCAK